MQQDSGFDQLTVKAKFPPAAHYPLQTLQNALHRPFNVMALWDQLIVCHANGPSKLQQKTGFSVITPQPLLPCTLERGNVISFDNCALSYWPVFPRSLWKASYFQRARSHVHPLLSNWFRHCKGRKWTEAGILLCLFQSKLLSLLPVKKKGI